MSMPQARKKNTPVFFACVSAWGSAVIKNSCGDDVYFWAVGDTPGSMITVPAGTSYPQAYFCKTGGGGPSLKIGTKYPSGSKVGEIPGIWDIPQANFTQFEYTVGSAGPPANAVFYDISNINGYPFMCGGVKMTSSDGSVNVACPKGVEKCQAAYNQPYDDHATGSAPDHVNLTLELCSDAPGMIAGGADACSGGSSGGSTTVASTSAAVVASPAVTSSAAPVKANEKVNLAAVVVSSSSAVPSPTTTPPPTSPEEDVVVVVDTVYADPVTVTVHAMADGSKMKRQDHVHQHVHNKIHKKRHGGN